MNAEPASAPAGNPPLIEVTPIGVPGNSAPLELPQSSVAPHEAPSRSASQLPNADDWATATAVLHELLNVNSGLASSIAVREALQRRGVAEARVPVQWPRKLTPDLVEKELFVERYRHHFEDACVVPRRDSRQYPNLR
jgi:hypothetical protein